jgi:hypothetical protein
MLTTKNHLWQIFRLCYIFPLYYRRIQMSTKIVQLDFLPKDDNFNEMVVKSLKCAFAGHNKIKKQNDAIIEFHEAMMYHIFETQDMLLKMCDRLYKMESTVYVTDQPIEI